MYFSYICVFKINIMHTDYERYRKMASLAQVGWWEADLTGGYYLCSDFSL